MAALAALGVLALASCSDEAGSSAQTAPDLTAEPTSEPPSTATTEPATSPPTTDAPTTTSSTTTSTSTSTTTSTTVAPTTTVPPTTVAPVPGQPNPACIVVVAPGDSLGAIVDRINSREVNTDSLVLENGLADPDVINAGMELDVCPSNGVDDRTGQPWVPPTTAPPATAPVPTPPAPVDGLASGVHAQQQKLNELFGPLGMRTLEVDGVSGRMTRQLLCAARLALGMPVSRDDMVPGSPEEKSLMAATGLQIPPGAPVHANRWALIDQHCQVMFVGEGSNRLVYVFPTSTGTNEFPTRDQNASRAFRFNPALDNGGWHDSSDYPASVDNPLNGNMYKPIYFDGGQAIHGANTVPTSPASHGCARLRVSDQDTLISWLGLGDVDRQLWDAASRIDFTVTIVGRY